MQSDADEHDPTTAEDSIRCTSHLSDIPLHELHV
jgi:hypothetical protein